MIRVLKAEAKRLVELTCLKRRKFFCASPLWPIGHLPDAHLNGGAVSIAQITIEEEA